MVDASQLLRNAFPGVNDSVLGAMYRLARTHEYPADTVLCVEGEAGDTFYLVADGRVQFSKRMPNGEEKVMREGDAGSFFGEMSLLHETPRSATVTTVDATTVIEIDRATFEAAVQQNPGMIMTLIRTVIDRMRANDAQALAEIQVEKEKVEQAYEELQYQEEKRNEFLDTMAHELRTPLTAAKGYIQLIKAGALEGPALTMGIDKVNSSFNRIISLVNDLLFVQEMDLLDFGFSKVNIGDLIREALEAIAAMNPRGAAMIQLRLPDDLPPLIADHDGLLRAFVHLLDNAVKFSPEGGDIMVESYASDSHIFLIFADHGVGIPPEFMPRLFERFERVETYGEYLFGGLGLGLPIVKHIIESHGGTITVESERGVGSAFTIQLPLDAKRATSTLPTLFDPDEWMDVPNE